MELYTGSLNAGDIGVEVLFADKCHPDEYVLSQELSATQVNGHRTTFECNTQLTLTGSYSYTFRVFAQHPLLPHRQDFPLVMWI